MCSCGRVMPRAIDKEGVTFIGDIEPRYDVSLGMNVSSRRDYREKLAYNDAYSKDMFIGGDPSAGRLTKEERLEYEDKQSNKNGTVFDKRGSGSWGKGPSDPEEGITVVGKADYDSIKQTIKKQHVLPRNRL